MSEPVYNSIQELLDQLKTGRGHTFASLDVNHRLTGEARNDKGVLGKIVEEGVFHYSVNSRPEADFANLGVELKTTGYRRTRNGLSFKERIPLNCFDYQDVENNDFENSEMWHKCQQLLIALYEYLDGKTYGEMILKSGFYHTFPEEDIEIMKQDYKLLQDKIKSGRADTISETDTNYLGACTSGAGHGQLDRTASNHYHLNLKPRKFALKAGYMTGVLRRLFEDGNVEHVIDLEELKEKSLEEVILDKLKLFIGKTESELKERFNIGDTSKSRFERYVAGMLGIKGQCNKTDEFVKSGLELKTIRVEANGNIEQNMSFPYFDFREIVDQEWEDTDFYQLLANKKYLFAIFENNGKEYVFKRIKLWHIPGEILDEEGYKVFSKLKEVLLSGNIVRGFQTQKDGKVVRLNNFPKSADNQYFHVRPHGENGGDTNPLPVPDQMTGAIEYTKQCFWLKKSYILEVINEE